MMLAAAAAAGEPNPWVGPAIIAALVSGLVSLTTLALTGRRERKERHRQLMADAFAACQTYKEFPYKVRRRRSDAEAQADHSRISDELSAVQAALADHRARFMVEAPAVAVFFGDLVAVTRGVAGSEIRAGWTASPVGPDSGSSIILERLAEIEPYEARYLESVKDHLSVWPYRLCRVTRSMLRRRTSVAHLRDFGDVPPSEPAEATSGGDAA
jgi:hypothetical protein